MLAALLVAGALASPLRAQQPALPAHALAAITPEKARAHVAALASDAMMGRATPSPELDSAAAYIAGVFRGAGLSPVAGKWFHTYDLKQTDLGSPNSLKVDGRAFELKSGFIPYEHSGSGHVAADVVFAGYGVTRADGTYDDYAGLDAAGKIVLVVAGAPSSARHDGASERDFAIERREANTLEKMLNASRHGAAALMILADPNQTRTLTPGGYPWRSFYPGSALDPLPLELDLPPAAPAIPSVGISGEAAKRLFGGSLASLVMRLRQIDSTGLPAPLKLGHRVELTVTIATTRIPAGNVVGMIPGRLHPDQFVVIGAHYDHVGHGRDFGDDGKPMADTIYNGADDNASGTAALLMIADALGSLAADERPDRSVLLIAFSGEERGLYGSRAYVAFPLVPNASLVAMINMDMIGRNAPDSVSVGGWSRSKGLGEIVEQANAAEPMGLGREMEGFFGRSDQASFAAVGVPSIFLSSGLHADYHRVTDAPEKIDAGKLAHVARLCLRTAWLAAGSAGRFDQMRSGEDAGE